MVSESKAPHSSKEKKVCLCWAIYFGTALILQTVFPSSFHPDWFAFPINAALLLSGIALLWILHREKPASRLSYLLSAPATTFILLTISACTFLLLGLTNWVQPESWWFFFLLTALSAHLVFVLLRGLKKKRKYRLRFFLNHAGLFLALIGGFAGGADTDLCRMRVSAEETTQQAFSNDGRSFSLRNSFRLEDFIVEHDASGVPENYEARIRIDGKPVSLRVNHPYSLSLSDDLYLINYEHVPSGDQVGYCILEIIHQPWKYVEWAGICMLMLGSILLFAQGIAPADKKGGRHELE